MFEVIKSVKTRLSSEDEDNNNDHGGLVTQEAAPKLKKTIYVSGRFDE